MTQHTRPFSDAIKEEAQKRIEFTMRNRNKLVEAWIAETGLPPSRCELVEQSFSDGRHVVFVRERGAETIPERVSHCLKDAIPGQYPSLEWYSDRKAWCLVVRDRHGDCLSSIEASTLYELATILAAFVSCVSPTALELAAPPAIAPEPDDVSPPG